MRLLSGIRLLSELVVFFPAQFGCTLCTIGDDLITSCSYDTRNESAMVFSGYSIKEEMCVNYVYYYPKINLELCKSSIDTKALDAYFRYGNWIPSSSYGYFLADPTD